MSLWCSLLTEQAQRFPSAVTPYVHSVLRAAVPPGAHLVAPPVLGALNVSKLTNTAVEASKVGEAAVELLSQQGGSVALQPQVQRMRSKHDAQLQAGTYATKGVTCCA